MLKLTVTKTYTPDPNHYPDGASEQEMAEMDKDNVYDIVLSSIEDEDLQVTIEVI